MAKAERIALAYTSNNYYDYSNIKTMRNFLLFLSFLGVTFVSQARDKRDKLIAPQVAVFYPHDFDSVANMPSFALVKEFPSIGKVADSWRLSPAFYHTGKQTCLCSHPRKKGNQPLWNRRGYRGAASEW